MNVIDKLAEEGGNSVSRAGAWAVLACGLILALVLAIYSLGSKMLPPMTEFVSSAAESTRTNADNVKKLSESMVLANEAHASLMASMVEMQKAVRESVTLITANGENITLSSRAVDEMLKMMQEAYTMMQATPDQREQQLELLTQIDKSIQQLREEVKLQRPAEGTN